MSNDLVDRLRLVRSPGIGPVTYRQLISRFGSPAAALEAVPDLAARGGGRPPRLISRSDAEREIASLDALGGRYLVLGFGLYPRALAELDDAPPLLTVKGDLKLLERPLVAIVGARNSSAAACRFARQLAYDLGQQGTVVVSGLARGIDSAAHDGSFETGTIGVVAGGFDVFLSARKPAPAGSDVRGWPSDRRIAAGHRAARTALSLSQPDHRRPEPRHGGGGSSSKSGSLITARLAAEAGREVMAVPGSPLDPRAQGCNQLIRQGATLVQNAADVLEAVRPIQPGFASPRAVYELAELKWMDGDAGALGLVEELLGPSPVPVDEVIRLSGVPSGAVQMALLELDLAGRLDRHAGGKVSLRPA